MADQSLIDYVKQNTAAGFSEGEIRAALRGAGWEEPEIMAAFAAAAPKAEPVFPAEDAQLLPPQESFFDKYRRLLIIIAVTLVALPLLSFGGFWGYQKLFKAQAPAPAPQPTPPVDNRAQEQARQEQEQKAAVNAAASRDKQRLADIQGLQEALDEYFLAKQLYPENLNSLVEDGLIQKLPADPSSQRPYLYTALGEPALNYTISFLLETDLGPLKAGLAAATPTSRVDAQAVNEQNELIKGVATRELPLIGITDLSAAPFYPQEEVTLTITPAPNTNIGTAALTVGNISLTDRKAPFSFSFSAPKNPGEYRVQVFAFDSGGQGYFASTTLTVKN